MVIPMAVAAAAELLVLPVLPELADPVGEEPETIEEVYEPYLIMEGYLNRTPQGRIATELAYRRLGLRPIQGNQAALL